MSLNLSSFLNGSMYDVNIIKLRLFLFEVWMTFLEIIQPIFKNYNLLHKMNTNDQQLRYYINEVFNRYDRDRNGSLDVSELAQFFTDLYRSLGYNVQISIPQAQQALRQIDLNNDGRASPEELFYAFKLILTQQNKFVQNIQPIVGYQPMYPAQYNVSTQQPIYYQHVGYQQIPVNYQQPSFNYQQPNVVYQQPYVGYQQPQVNYQQQNYSQQSQYPMQNGFSYQQGQNNYQYQRKM